MIRAVKDYVSGMIEFINVFLLLSHAAFDLFLQVMQQQTLDELGIWTAILFPITSEMSTQKTIKISLSFSKLVSVMSRMVLGVFCSF